MQIISQFYLALIEFHLKLIKRLPLYTLFLISLNSLSILGQDVEVSKGSFLAPMIDARRMEVYTQILDHEHKIIKKTWAEVLTEDSFNDHLLKHKVLAFWTTSEVREIYASCKMLLMQLVELCIALSLLSLSSRIATTHFFGLPWMCRKSPACSTHSLLAVEFSIILDWRVGASFWDGTFLYSGDH